MPKNTKSKKNKDDGEIIVFKDGVFKTKNKKTIKAMNSLLSKRAITCVFLFLSLFSFGQTRKEKQVLEGLNKLNFNKVTLVSDPELQKEAKKFADGYNDTITSQYIEHYFKFNTPAQKYLCYITFTDKKYNGKVVGNFFCAQDSDFLKLVQYKSRVGISANDKMCIILFYNHKNVLTVAN